jgi:regulator of cell morphogenesis and NO signaling
MNTERSVDALCDDIVARYHASLHRQLPRIRAELAALSTAESSLALRELQAAFADLSGQLAGHLAKEEHLLFPALAALAAAEQEPARRRPATFVTILHPIRLMEAEHVRIEAALDRLRERTLHMTGPERLLPAWPRCVAELAQLDQDLREHHRMEDEILFPRALELERRLR